MIKSKKLTLEDVCTLSNGFDTDYNAVSYLIKKDNKKAMEVTPKQWGKYMVRLQEIVKEIDPKHYRETLITLKSGLLTQYKEAKQIHRQRILENRINIVEKEIRELKEEKIQKPLSITYKGKEYNVDYDIKYRKWWSHAIYQNTLSKKKEGDDINPISLALACFMSNKINGSIEIKDIAELEQGLLSETSGIKLYHAGFFLLKPRTIFKKVLYKIFRIS